MRRLPKPVVAMVAGYAVGGGHVLHVCCDLTIAADNARFGQTGPRVGSWDGGFGASLLRDLVGTKKAKEFWLLCRLYDAEEALEMGLVNTVVPLDRLEAETVAWCREMLALSPFALRLVKASFNAHEDGYAGIQQLAHDANLLFYGSEEAREGREAFKEKRQPDFSKFPQAAMSVGRRRGVTRSATFALPRAAGPCAAGLRPRPRQTTVARVQPPCTVSPSRSVRASWGARAAGAEPHRGSSRGWCRRWAGSISEHHDLILCERRRCDASPPSPEAKLRRWRFVRTRGSELR